MGWVHFEDDDESWEHIGHRMKEKLGQALAHHPIEEWSTQVKSRKEKLLSRLSDETTSPLVRQVYNWHPPDTAYLNEHVAQRGPGRPRQQWDIF